MIRIPSRIGGVKWEPVAAMIALLFVGLWLVYSPEMRVTPGARAESVKIGNTRGVIEVTHAEDGKAHVFTLVLRDGHRSAWSESQVRELFGERVLAQLTADRPNALFRLLNITSWTSLAWVLVGLGGQVLFAGRTLVQWFISERERKSVVPAAFWWMSLTGGVALFAYFAWRQDLVGVLGQCSGVVIYARNLRLIFKARKKAASEA